MRPMETAPRNGTSIVIITAVAAHRADWDSAFHNFWSSTAQRALGEEEPLGWMSTADWKAFALQKAAAK